MVFQAQAFKQGCVIFDTIQTFGLNKHLHNRYYPVHISQPSKQTHQPSAKDFSYSVTERVTNISF